MLEQLLNFLFARGPLKQAAGTTQQNPRRLPVDNANAGVTQMDVAKMAQDQADNELRKKLAAQRASRGPLFMGPQQQ